MAHKKDFNYRITEFFLNNTRLTILSLFLLVVVGIFATLSLKTVGFPNPEIKFTIVNTAYPGADAGTILRDVTEPLEDSISDIDGIETYNSQSLDSFSSLSIGIEGDADKTAVDADIKEAIGGVVLPEDAVEPNIFSPEIGGADILLSLYQADPQQRFADTQNLIDFIEDLPETDEVTQDNEFSQSVVLTLDPGALTARNLEAADVERTILSSDETLPVVTGVELDGQVQSIVTSLSQDVSYEELNDLEIFYTIEGAPGTPPVTESVELGEISTLEKQYSFANPGESLLGIRDESGEGVVLEVVSLNVKTKENVDQTQYYNQIKDFIADTDDLDFTNGELPETEKTVVIDNYTQAAENEEQVNEVLSGLLGGPLDVDNAIASNLGWALGGIQLVFLVMLAFVSWRAAVIAAASIPLSLVFSNIYLFLIGENLNTLVLFSFVLVIGLVVDPALVILESIQRKIDTGLSGKEAALAAVRDVGLGLFLATLTNIIVFTPFGIISGVLGQIFRNIPLTILPAVIGSYIVPLIFLSWIGSAFMKRGKNTSTSEEENLWPIARWLIRLNTKILNSNRLLRAFIIILGLVLSFGVTGILFTSGNVRSVQFATGDDPAYFIVQTEFKAGLTDSDRSTGIEKLVGEVITTRDVSQVFLNNEFGVFARTDVDRDRTTREIAEDVNKDLGELDKYFLDIKAEVAANGPPEPLYQVAIAVKDDNLEIIKDASIAVGKEVETICEDGGTFVINNCDGEENIVAKVDDGFSGRTTKVITYNLDRGALANNGLLSPQGPASILANQQLRGQFPVASNTEELTTINVAGEERNLFVRTGDTEPQAESEISSSSLTNFQGQDIPLNDVVESTTTTDSQSAIRRVDGETVNTVQVRLTSDYSDQGTAAQVTTAIVDYYADNDFARTIDLGLQEENIESFDGGGSAGFLKSFQELLLALVLAIVFSYFVLAVFFNSLTQPFTILYTIPLTFIGIFPAIGFLSNGQFGLLEIIGLIILVGLVENVAIFLLDSANQYIQEGKDPKSAIAFASGIRMRPVILTNLTAVASLAPLAFLSETYRPLSLVIIFGLSTSGLVSLVTTPILFIFFRWLSYRFRQLSGLSKVVFFALFPIYVIVWGLSKKGDEHYETAASTEPQVSQTAEEKTGFFAKKSSLDTSKLKKGKK